MNNLKTNQLGDLIYQAIDENSVYESCSWATQRINRVMKKLTSVEGIRKIFKVVIPYLGEQTAFTAPGRYIFISRQMFQMCRNDEMAAFIIAHEMAHHSLGHFSSFLNSFKNTTSSYLKLLMLVFYRMIEKRIYGVKMECDADKHAIEHCLRTGYDGEKCLSVFHILEDEALNKGNINMVFGPEELDDVENNQQSWSYKFKKWVYYSKRGYLPLRDRKKMLKLFCLNIQKPNS